MAETQTPIETLKRAQIYNCRSADPEHCKLLICTDARVALEDMGALVASLRLIKLKVEVGRSGSYTLDDTGKALAWIDAECNIALDKFQVKS